jgi:hypothetical protein
VSVPASGGTVERRRIGDAPGEDGIRMGLSEHERRAFAEIERQLAEEDPRFVARTRRRLSAWSPQLRLRVAGALGVLGVIGVLSLTFEILLAAAGMAALLGAVLLGASARADLARPGERTGPLDRR